MVDYREYGRQGENERWISRLTTDFAWSGNLFEFCRKALLRLYEDLKVPFALGKGGVRQDETPVHVALREALVNTLIHADYAGTSPVVIAKFTDRYEFYNPGLLRLPKERAFQGGVANSDCRNRTIQKMFEMIGYAEQAGSGFPKILAGCDFWGVKHPEMSEDIELYQMKFIFHRPGGVKGGVKRGVKGGVNREEDSIDALINIIRNNPGRRIPFYADLAGRTIKAVEHDIEDLRRCDPPKIEFRGAPKTGGYFVKEQHD